MGHYKKKHFGGIKQHKCMVIFRDSLKNSLLFGLVSYLMTPAASMESLPCSPYEEVLGGRGWCIAVVGSSVAEGRFGLQKTSPEVVWIHFFLDVQVDTKKLNINKCGIESTNMIKKVMMVMKL